MNSFILVVVGCSIIIGLLIGFSLFFNWMCDKMGDLWGSLAFVAVAILGSCAWAWWWITGLTEALRYVGLPS